MNKIDFLKYLRGEWPYEIECSQYSSAVLPTDVDRVLMREVYPLYLEMPEMKENFEDAIKTFLNGPASDVYTAILYFDACLFAEEQGRATFSIDREKLVPCIQESIRKNEKCLKEGVEFPNGLVTCAWNYLLNFNKFYQKEYGFRIIEVADEITVENRKAGKKYTKNS